MGVVGRVVGATFGTVAFLFGWAVASATFAAFWFGGLLVAEQQWQ